MTQPLKLLPMPVDPVSGWHSFPHPRPYVTTSGFAFDAVGRFPILYRGDKVRSARNCWSLPSGLHEIGYTLAEQFAIELKEECGLAARVGSTRPVATYENIAPDLVDKPNEPQWHWVIHILATRVETLATFTNKEPDKHPQFKFITVEEIPSIAPWGKGLGKALLDNLDAIVMVRDIICSSISACDCSR